MKQFVRLSSGLLSLVAIVGMIFAATHRQDIYDWFALRNYNPPQRIVELADSTTMTGETRRVFYVSHPALNNKSEFRKNCPTSEQSIVLGCYVSNQGIFLLEVNDPRLNGIIEVTTAHEVLHAGYDRLSSSEREKVDTMTSNFFASLQNERIQKSIEQYRKKDPGIVPNELHSILGTEVRGLTPELDEYYKRYFNDRQAIVGYSEKYEQTFVDLQNQVEQFDSRLNRLKSQIETYQNRITREANTIEAQRRRLDALLASNQTEAYNAAVPGFNRVVNEYNGLISTARQLIEEYNSLVEQRNELATTEQELIQAIDSNVAPKQESQ